jgi:hypothetical protein
MNFLCLTLMLLFAPAILQKDSAAQPAKEYRILSVSESAKLVLISDLATKTRYLLDASQAKIIVEGKEAEIKSLQNYSSAEVLFEKKKAQHEGVDLDGVALRISVNKKK